MQFLNIDPRTLTSSDIAELSSGIDEIRGWISAFDRQIEKLVTSGEMVKGYELSVKRTNRMFSKHISDNVLIRAGVPANKLYTSKLISPAQAMKYAQDDISINLLEQFIEQKDGKPTVKRIA